MATATVTSKGQVTIPRRIRERLGVKPGDRISFREGPGGTVVVEAGATDLLALAGSVRPRRLGVSLEDMEEAIAAGAAGRRKPA